MASQTAIKRKRQELTRLYETCGSVDEFLDSLAEQLVDNEPINGDDSGHAENLFRVKEKIGRLIVQFCEKKGVGGTFHGTDLNDYVEARVEGLAPGSPLRILRELRLKKTVDYENVSRRDSLYRLTKVPSRFGRQLLLSYRERVVAMEQGGETL